MGYRVKPFTMSVRDNSTQEFIDVGLLGSDVDADVEELRDDLDNLKQKTVGNLNSMGHNLLFRTIKRRYDTNHFGNSEPAYFQLQGGCVASDGSIIQMYPDQNTVAKSNTTLIEKHSRTGELIVSVTGTYGHANDCTVTSNGKLLIEEGMKYIDGTSQRIKTIAILDANTLALEQEIEADEPIYGICEHNGIIVSRLVSDAYQLVSINLSTGALQNYLRIGDPAYDPTGKTFQTLASDGNYFYMAFTHPSVVYKINTDGELEDVYNIPEFVNDVYKIGELQWFDHSDDHEFIYGFSASLRATEFNGVVCASPYICQEEIFTKTGTGTYYVDNSTDILKPDGSQSKPFKELAECIYALDKIDNPAYINVVNTGVPYHATMVMRPAATHVNGNGATIEGVWVFCDCRLYNAVLSNNNPSNLFFGANFGTVSVNNLSFQVDQTPAADSFQITSCKFIFGNQINLTGISSAFIKLTNSDVTFVNHIPNGGFAQIFSEATSSSILAKVGAEGQADRIIPIGFNNGFTNAPIFPISAVNTTAKTISLKSWVTSSMLQLTVYGECDLTIAGITTVVKMAYQSDRNRLTTWTTFRDNNGCYVAFIVIDFTNLNYQITVYNAATNTNVSSTVVPTIEKIRLYTNY